LGRAEDVSADDRDVSPTPDGPNASKHLYIGTGTVPDAADGQAGVLEVLDLGIKRVPGTFWTTGLNLPTAAPVVLMRWAGMICTQPEQPDR
jgi:hypothetical protein